MSEHSSSFVGSNGKSGSNGSNTMPMEIVVRPEPTSQAIVQSSEPIVVVDHVELPEPLDRRLVLLHSPASAAARSYRLLRHRLLTSGNPRVITVTSAAPGEGKTSCAANLALAIAEDAPAGVLLLDATRQRAAIAGMFGAEDAAPVRGGTDDQHCYSVISVGETGLHVGIAGQLGARGRLDRRTFWEIVGDLRTSFDYIVIDSSSVSESADADVACELADGVLLAVRAGSTRRATVSRVMEELHPSPILGLVLVGT